MITAKELGRMLFEIHIHCDRGIYDEIVYREEDIVELLVKLGLPRADFSVDPPEECVVCGKRATYCDPRFMYMACEEHKDIPPAELHKVIAEYKKQNS